MTSQKTTRLYLLPALLALLLIPAARLNAATSTPDEQAAFLAGLPLPPQSPLSAAQQGEAYREHRKELSDKWAFCRKVRYDAMQKWGEEHLRKVKDQEVVRYLFGGPDFLNAYAFFPNAGTMVLGGLEPVGEVPPPENLKPGNLAPALASLRQSLRTSLYCGYFITSEMGGQLQKGSFRGVLPVLYTELALTGNHIDTVDFEKPFGSPGVRITYHRPGHPLQTLYYFQANLANGPECGRFLSWLGSLGRGATYLKAASYLLHGSEFSQTRDFLLKTSSLIVEDDSGIPYRSFGAGGWTIQLFGEYASPLPIFSGYLQKDFRDAYKSSQYAGPIPFGAGYHVVPAHANILLACSGAAPLPAKPMPDPTIALKDQEARQAEADLIVSIRAEKAEKARESKERPKTVAKSKSPAQSTTQSSPQTMPADVTAAPSSGRASLAQLENEELRIRRDASIGKAERSALLQDVWNRQLIAMGKTPAYRVTLPKPTPAPAPLNTAPAIPAASPASAPDPTPAPVPAHPSPQSTPTSTPVETSPTSTQSP